MFDSFELALDERDDFDDEHVELESDLEEYGPDAESRIVAMSFCEPRS